MNSMRPGVSVMTWRLRPVIFLPASWPQTPPPSVVLTDWLSITPAPGDACLPVRGRARSSGNVPIDHALPQPAPSHRPPSSRPAPKTRPAGRTDRSFGRPSPKPRLRPKSERLGRQGRCKCCRRLHGVASFRFERIEPTARAKQRHPSNEIQHQSGHPPRSANAVTTIIMLFPKARASGFTPVNSIRVGGCWRCRESSVSSGMCGCPPICLNARNW